MICEVHAQTAVYCPECEAGDAAVVGVIAAARALSEALEAMARTEQLPPKLSALAQSLKRALNVEGLP